MNGNGTQTSAGGTPQQATHPGPGSRPSFGGRWQRRPADATSRRLGGDLVLYGLSTAFASYTVQNSTLLPHVAWADVAIVGYLAAAAAVLGLIYVYLRLPAVRLGGTVTRATLIALTWAGTALLPLVWQAVERAGGRLDRAQEEVVVIEQAGARLLDHGTPYLGRDAIAALPVDERLLGYTPYQPGMAIFGLPRAVAGDVWWTDARVWFAVGTAAALLAAVLVLRRPAPNPALAPGAGRADSAALLRAVQIATVFPTCALTLATGGDDLPVLALCLLALALAARGRYLGAGLAVGLAAALKLFAWPVALVLLVHTIVHARSVPGGTRSVVPRFAATAFGLPVLALVPPLLVDPAALVENVLRFPLGHGLVASPAQSPFPGHLIAQAFPGGRVVATALLVAAGLVIAVLLVRRPPRTAASAALYCGCGLLAAILLMPATRFGYLLYPVAFLAWVPALRPTTPTSEGVSGAANTSPATAS